MPCGRPLAPFVRNVAVLAAIKEYQSLLSPVIPGNWTVSTKKAGPKARKAIPPEVIALSVAVTVLSSVTPSLSKTRPAMAPPTFQVTSKRYQ